MVLEERQAEDERNREVEHAASSGAAAIQGSSNGSLTIIFTAVQTSTRRADVDDAGKAVDDLEHDACCPRRRSAR